MGLDLSIAWLALSGRRRILQGDLDLSFVGACAESESGLTHAEASLRVICVVFEDPLALVDHLIIFLER